VNENAADEGRRAAGAGAGLPLARIAKIVLVILAFCAAGLVAVAVLNPAPQPHRVDYGGFHE
jgi:hypothetical protein